MIVPREQIGLTWDHPRGHSALAAAAARVLRDIGRPVLRWERQPLEGFESRPIGELAATHDLLVLDHPHIGEAVAQRCLVPLQELFAAEQLVDWRERTMGAAMSSYEWEGCAWALPLDVATQVMASRADLLPGPVPRSWDEVACLASRRPVALSVAGPHALLMVFAICAGLGHLAGGADLLPEAAFAEAWRLLSHLYALVPAGTDQLNPIALLEAMAGGDAIGLVPLIYGYVNYAVAGPGRHAITFDNAPAAPGGRHGSVLGGTGIAITRRASPSPELLRHLAWLMSIEAQRDFIPDHAGQPAARLAWEDARVNARWGGFYRRTAATAADAMVRPRHDGYIAFQTRGAAIVRAALNATSPPRTVLSALRGAWRDSFARATSGEATPP